MRDNVAHFGAEVEKAFGSAVEDIQEAARCLALERTTASVFHVMRAMEVAVQVVGSKLGATVVDEHGRTLPWGVIAEKMKREIDKLPRGSEAQMMWYRAQSFLVVLNRA